MIMSVCILSLICKSKVRIAVKLIYFVRPFPIETALTLPNANHTGHCGVMFRLIPR